MPDAGVHVGLRFDKGFNNPFIPTYIGYGRGRADLMLGEPEPLKDSRHILLLSSE